MRTRSVVLVATTVVATLLTWSPAPLAQSGQSSLYARIRSTRAARQVASSQAADCRAELRKSEARLAQAQKQLKDAEKRLIETRQSITDTMRAVDRAERDLRHQREVSGQRLRAMHKSAQVGVLEVMIGAEDFTAMTTRSYVHEKLARADADIVRLIDERKREAEALRLELEKKKARVEQERGRIAEANARIAEETERVRTLTAQKQAQADALAREEAVLEAQSRALTQTIQRATSGGRGYSGTYAGTFQGPIRGILTSGFGPRGGRRHEGIDIAAPTGTQIGSAGGGRVVSAGWQDGYGNCVVVDHGGGRTTVYGHMSRIDVHAGEDVSAGQDLGAVGSTGRSTGPHLHYEVRVNGSPVNPMGQ
jgi:murein DD-endopeptidase MepM/ murein hydrolase activator NlpD